jgi:crotonobetainyl-CoA:carnitine CoA-transferase CaiB-like acyl-CoA transferase
MPPQNLGAQTYEILREFEFSEIEITDFIRNKVVT